MKTDVNWEDKTREDTTEKHVLSLFLHLQLMCRGTYTNASEEAIKKFQVDLRSKHKVIRKGNPSSLKSRCANVKSHLTTIPDPQPHPPRCLSWL